MKKKEAVKYSLEQMDAEQKKIQQDIERERLSKSKETAQPTLLKRIGAGLLDFLFTGGLFALLFVFSYFVIFPSTGYQSAAQTIIETHENSELFIIENGKYEQIIDHYDDSKTPEENYDVHITHFYSTDERAVKDNKLEAYNNSKLSSGYYEIDGEGNIVRISTVSSETARVFLQNEYMKAVNYFDSSEVLLKAVKTTYNTMIISILITVTISCAVMYFAVPLLEKKNRSFGYMIFKIIPVDSSSLQQTSKSKIALRSLIFVILTFISPITMYYWLGSFTFIFIPFFLNTVVLCFSKTNSGIHDIAAKINVINESHSNAFQNLKNIIGDNKQQ